MLTEEILLFMAVLALVATFRNMSHYFYPFIRLQFKFLRLINAHHRINVLFPENDVHFYPNYKLMM